MRHKIYLIALLGVILASCHNSQTAMFGVNPLHNGVYESSFAENISLSEKWKFKTNGRISGSAVVVDETIIFGSEDSCLYALNSDGTLKWQFKSNGRICSTPAVCDGVVYVNNYGGMFYAISSKTGKELWSFKTDGEFVRTGKGLNWCTPKDSLMPDMWDFYTSSPIIEEGVVYFGSGYNVYAINLETKTVKWKFTAPNVVHSTPAVAFNRVYFGCWDSKLYAVNILTGRAVWSAQTGVDDENHGMEGIQSSPSIVDSMVVVGARDAHVYSYNALSGDLIWKQKFAQTWMPSSFAYDGKYIYTGSSDIAKLLVLDKLDGKTVTSANTGCYTFSTPAVAGNMAFIGSTNGALYAVNIKTGVVVSTFETVGRKSNPLNVIASNGTLNNEVFADINGSKFEYAQEYVRRLFTSGSVLSTPVIDKNVVYFGSVDGYFYAVR